MMRRLGCLTAKLFASRTGNVTPIMAMVLVPLIGVMGLAAEGANWFYSNRSMQNAADSAVMAVAASGCSVLDTSAPTIGCRGYARAVTTRYGFTNGTGDVTVDSTLGDQTCGSNSDCYKVTVSKKVPFYLMKVVGFTGNTTTSSGDNAQTISASAMARVGPMEFCIWTKGVNPPKNTDAFHIDGGPNVDLSKCPVYSGGPMWCTQKAGTAVGYAVYAPSTSDNKCGVNQVTSTIATDPYANWYSNWLVTNPLSGCGVATSNGNWGSCVYSDTDFTVPATGISVTPSSGNTVLVIKNGHNLVLNGKLSTSSGGLTIVFTGTSGAAGFITGTGTVDFAAPTSGPWSGIALYQDPALTTQTSVTYSGGAPTLDITGLLYLPYMNLTINGEINRATIGAYCIGLIVNTLLSNGTGAILAHPTGGSSTVDCLQAGLTNLPTTNFGRPILVQ